MHGGTILKLIDQAGFLAATKYANQNRAPKDRLMAVLARIEECAFLRPMKVGEVSECEAVVTYVSTHSVEVLVNVYASNALTGERKHTNAARLWYICVPLSEVSNKGPHLSPAQLPPMAYAKQTDEAEGHERYEKQKHERKIEKRWATIVTAKNNEGTTPLDKEASTLNHLVLPSDCYLGGVAQAGSVMKLMVRLKDVFFSVCNLFKSAKTVPYDDDVVVVVFDVVVVVTVVVVGCCC